VPPDDSSSHPSDSFAALSGSGATELFAAEGETRREYAPVLDVLGAHSMRELARRQGRLDRAVEELGLQLSGERTRRSRVNPWRLDLFPLVLGAATWERIARGVVQRALAFNAYAADLYGPQNILRERRIPHELALRDPAFLRQLSGIEVPEGEYSQFGAFDLVKDAEGDWRVVEHHMGTPFGLSHVLQNRRILSRVFPELYERADVAPVATFSTYLLEMLRAQSPKMNPNIVLLTTGRHGQAYFEEAFIARHMGLAIAQPGDLVVREGRVFLKTIRGLEPVDVIFRRIESAALDPIAVPEPGGGGVPGLINVWRKGRVAIVNAPGVGVADNRALLRYDETLIGYYLRESAVLRSVETFHLDDVDQRGHVAEHTDSLLIKPVQDHDSLWRKCGGKRPRPTPAAMERVARRFPDYFVAQSIPEAASLPRFGEGGFDARGIFLRVYYILGKEPIVLPGGLARHSAAVHRTRRLTLVTDGLKDVLVPDGVVEEAPPRRPPAAVGERFSIGSRSAEALYWAGRYIERAENTAREFETLEQLRWDQMASSEQRTYWPLLQAVAVATGQAKYAKRKRPPSDTLPLSRSLLLDAGEGASVRTCIDLARRLFESVREILSPECREVLEEIALGLAARTRGRASRARLRQVGETVVSEVARFNGTAERTMPHDDSWQFYRIGMFCERAVGTLLVLQVALPKIARGYRATDEENADLTALLRLLGSLDAYRRTYRSRAYVDRVAELMVHGSYNPSSVGFSLRNLHYAIGTLSTGGQRQPGEGLRRELDALLGELDRFSLKRGLFGSGGRPEAWDVDERPPDAFDADRIESELERLTHAVEAIHHRIEDVFFSHQEAFAREPSLFDGGL